MFARYLPIALALALPVSAAPLPAQTAAPAAVAACDSDPLCGRVPRPVGLYVSAVEEDGRYLVLEDGVVSDPAAPFGGVKQSGIGREGGHGGQMDYLESK